MADIRQVTDKFAVTQQIREEDITTIAEQGYKLVVNNRPDGEAFDQTPSAVIESAAHSLGLEYKQIPFSKFPSEAAVEEMMGLIGGANEPVLAFCKTGMRSVVLWAMASVQMGVETPQTAITKANAAGFDLQRFEPILSAI